MNFRLMALRLYVPFRLRRVKLHALLSAAATGFDKPAPNLQGLNFRQAWQTFATFTRAAGEELLATGQAPTPVLTRLAKATYELGRVLRHELHITTQKDALLALEILYAALGVKWHNIKGGMVIVRDCQFSKLYTPKICQLISAMDQGLVEGITDGGKLSWSERITEGRPCCRGRIVFP
jgi:hypothetical protein